MTKTPKTYRLDDATLEDLTYLADALRLSHTAVIQLAIARLRQQEDWKQEHMETSAHTVKPEEAQNDQQ